MLPGYLFTAYSVSHDEREVAFCSDRGVEMQIRIARFDRLAPPRLLVRSANEPLCDSSRHIFFRLLLQKGNYLYRVEDEGNSNERVLDVPISEFFSDHLDRRDRLQYSALNTHRSVAFPVVGRWQDSLSRGRHEDD